VVPATLDEKTVFNDFSDELERLQQQNLYRRRRIVGGSQDVLIAFDSQAVHQFLQQRLPWLGQSPCCMRCF